MILQLRVDTIVYWMFISGLEVIDHLLPSEVKKLAFVSIWFSFAFALFLLNRLNWSSVSADFRLY